MKYCNNNTYVGMNVRQTSAELSTSLNVLIKPLFRSPFRRFSLPFCLTAYEWGLCKSKFRAGYLVYKCYFTSIERCQIGKYVQGVDFLFPPSVVVKISWWHYFLTHPRTQPTKYTCNKIIMQLQFHRDDVIFFTRHSSKQKYTSVQLSKKGDMHLHNSSLRDDIILTFTSSVRNDQ